MRSRKESPSSGIAVALVEFGLCFAAISAVSFGPAWVVVPVIVAYAAMVG